VTFTNVLPANVNFVSATSSQGICSTNGAGTVYCTLSNLTVGAELTVTVVVTPTLPGALTNTASVTSADTDLNQANLTTTVITTVTAPTADLALSQSVSPNPAVVGGNLLYTISVTNNGPGTAFNVVVTEPLGGLTFVSAVSSPSLIPGSNVNGTATCNLGPLAPGSSAAVLLTVVPSSLGSYTNVATVSTASSDPNLTNNSASLVVTVVNPTPNIIPAGVTLLPGGLTYSNGAINPGETVTMLFGLRNTGTASTTNLMATLLATNGVTPMSDSKPYGALIPGGPADSNTYTFSASGTNGGVVDVVFQLQDGAANLGTVVFVFSFPATNTFANGPGSALHSGTAQPYPSPISVSGLNGVVSDVTVTLSNLSHSFPSDLEMLLVGPGGQDAVLMATAGGAYAVTNVTVTFDDAFRAPISPPISRWSRLFRVPRQRGRTVLCLERSMVRIQTGSGRCMCWMIRRLIPAASRVGA
jgi:uncharacterized repeat protein (TIGR01451 family)